LARKKNKPHRTMSDDERSQHEEEVEDDEDWTEPVDLEGLEDGFSTFLVGRFSKHATVASAVAEVKHKEDRVLVLAGEYRGDVALDSTVNHGLRISGDATVDASAVVFKGLLDVQYSKMEARAEETAGDDDEDKPAEAAPVVPLTLTHMTFESGGVFTELTDADVTDVVFGAAVSSTSSAEEVPRTVRCHGLSTVRFNQCHIYGMGRSAVYCYPHARCAFTDCKVLGAKRPVPPPSGTTAFWVAAAYTAASWSAPPPASRAPAATPKNKNGLRSAVVGGEARDAAGDGIGRLQPRRSTAAPRVVEGAVFECFSGVSAGSSHAGTSSTPRIAASPATRRECRECGCTSKSASTANARERVRSECVNVM
jgi:hypothetical protein